jgi:hypothetical protein
MKLFLVSPFFTGFLSFPPYYNGTSQPIFRLFIDTDRIFGGLGRSQGEANVLYKLFHPAGGPEPLMKPCH